MERWTAAARTTLASIAWCVMGIAEGAAAQPFEKVVDNTHTAPGLNVVFDDFDAPSLHELQLAFRAQSYTAPLPGTGVFRAEVGANVAAIATRATTSPAGGAFTDFGQASDVVSIERGTVAFVGLSGGGKGVFSGSGGALTTLAADDTDFPDTDVVPFRFYAPSLSGRVAVTMTNSPQTPYFSGVYSYRGAQLFTVVDTSPSTFGYFNIGNATTAASGPDEGVYVYDVNGSPTGPYSVYRRSYLGSTLGDPEAIVVSSQVRPDGNSIFTFPSRSQVDRSDATQLCFMDGIGLQGGGVFRVAGTAIETVADTDTPIPEGSGAFTDFGLYCAIDAGAVAFVGRGSQGQQGVYIGRPGGALEKVIDTGDLLGEAVPYLFDVSREALSGGRLAFKANAGAEAALWITQVPEPSASGLAAAALLVCAACSRRQAIVST